MLVNLRDRIDRGVILVNQAFRRTFVDRLIRDGPILACVVIPATFVNAPVRDVSQSRSVARFLRFIAE